jgi:hypothetical protein
VAPGSYTREQRAEALKLYAEHGPAEASRRTGIKRSTISKWASRAGVCSERAERTRKATEAALETYAERRARLGAKCAAEAEALVDRIRDANPLNAANLARAAHLLIRDGALLSDEAAQRVDDYPTQDEFDREVEKLVQEWEQVTGIPRRSKWPDGSRPPERGRPPIEAPAGEPTAPEESEEAESEPEPVRGRDPAAPVHPDPPLALPAPGAGTFDYLIAGIPGGSSSAGDQEHVIELDPA